MSVYPTPQRDSRGYVSQLDWQLAQARESEREYPVRVRIGTPEEQRRISEAIRAIYGIDPWEHLCQSNKR